MVNHLKWSTTEHTLLNWITFTYTRLIESLILYDVLHFLSPVCTPLVCKF